MVWFIALCLLAVITGIWLGKSGRPLKVIPSAVHKLLAVGMLVLAAIELFGGMGIGALPIMRQIAGITGLAALVSLFATGAVLSGKERKKALVAVHIVATAVVLVSLAAWLLYTPTQVDLPEQYSSVEYRTGKLGDRIENTTVRNDANEIYRIKRDELRERDAIHYKKAFGPIDNEKSAAMVAAYVHDTIYGEPSGDFVVGFNGIANAWIVYDELPDGWLGGSGVFAITKDTGEVIMGNHGK